MATSPRVRVLLVDDVAELRFLLRLNLELNGRFEVIGEAGDGVEAERLAERHQPDLVLLDVSMPLQDGLETLPLVRAAAPKAKVAMLSGFEARRLAPMAFSLGAVAYLEKGLPPERLVDELLEVLAA
jgi:DNA-binding NarL/FixJ family response regulator